ncbi:transcriptional regulator [Bordetella ansorpii]|uniref:Transcriptional regulator n=1 Tax=Bordetella ansorpii TaxID=288768 RepID=A0A157QRQ2_9BORD|nr:helix-turn-helix domain-containing protein [Bordetella ansorpii]SAI47639.1 transcriptional regulator [Bordetella ansorpii]
MTRQASRRQPPAALSRDALYSWTDIAPFVRVGRETWRRYIKAGTAPAPVQLGKRCSRYRGSDVLAWIESPSTYRANSKPTD